MVMWVGLASLLLLPSKPCDEQVKKKVEWASERFLWIPRERELKTLTPLRMLRTHCRSHGALLDPIDLTIALEFYIALR